MCFEYEQAAKCLNDSSGNRCLHKWFRLRWIIRTTALCGALFSMQLLTSSRIFGQWHLILVFLAGAFLLIHWIVNLNTKSVTSQVKRNLEGAPEECVPTAVKSLIFPAKWNNELQCLVYVYLLDSFPLVQRAIASSLSDIEAELLSTFISVGDARRTRLLTILDTFNPGAASRYGRGVLDTSLSYETWSASAAYIARTFDHLSLEFGTGDAQDKALGNPTVSGKIGRMLLQELVRLCGTATFALYVLLVDAALLPWSLIGLHIPAVVIVSLCDIAALSCWYTWRHIIPLLVPIRISTEEIRIAYDGAVRGSAINKLSVEELLHKVPVTYWRKAGLYAPTKCSCEPQAQISRYLCFLEIGRRLNDQDRIIQPVCDTATTAMMRAHLTELLITLKHRPRNLLTPDQIQFYVGIMKALSTSPGYRELDLIGKLSRCRAVGSTNVCVCNAARDILREQRSRFSHRSSLLLRPTEQTDDDLMHVPSPDVTTDDIVTSNQAGRGLR